MILSGTMPKKIDHIYPQPYGYVPRHRHIGAVDSTCVPVKINPVRHKHNAHRPVMSRTHDFCYGTHCAGRTLKKDR